MCVCVCVYDIWHFEHYTAHSVPEFEGFCPLLLVEVVQKLLACVTTSISSLENSQLCNKDIYIHIYIYIYIYIYGVRGGVVVKALRYEPAGRGFNS